MINHNSTKITDSFTIKVTKYFTGNDGMQREFTVDYKDHLNVKVLVNIEDCAKESLHLIESGVNANLDLVWKTLILKELHKMSIA